MGGSPTLALSQASAADPARQPRARRQQQQRRSSLDKRLSSTWNLGGAELASFFESSDVAIVEGARWDLCASSPAPAPFKVPDSGAGTVAARYARPPAGWRMGLLCYLPQELQQQVLSHLGARTLGQLSQASRACRRLGGCNVCWARLFRDRWPKRHRILSAADTHATEDATLAWKELYREQLWECMLRRRERAQLGQRLRREESLAQFSRWSKLGGRGRVPRPPSSPPQPTLTPTPIPTPGPSHLTRARARPACACLLAHG
jgi:hypothetical protein